MCRAIFCDRFGKFLLIFLLAALFLSGPALAVSDSAISLGSHKDDVLRIQGTPTGINRYPASGKEVWSYGFSTVTFSIKTNRVTEWKNDGKLKVSLQPGGQDSRPTRSYGTPYEEVTSAYGTILGIIMGLVVRREICSEKFPAMKTDFDEAFDGYTQRNRVLEKARDAVFLRARHEGGDAEAQRFSREMSAAMDAITNSVRTNVQRGITKTDCLDVAAAVRQGAFDLNIRNRKELDTIFGVR